MKEGLKFIARTAIPRVSENPSYTPASKHFPKCVSFYAEQAYHALDLALKLFVCVQLPVGSQQEVEHEGSVAFVFRYPDSLAVLAIGDREYPRRSSKPWILA